MLRIALGQALFARRAIANIIYPLTWNWFQNLIWLFKTDHPVIVNVMVLNCGIENMNWPV
jgi:hypothetical protein